MDWQTTTLQSHDLKRDFALAGLLALAGAAFFVAVNAALMAAGVDSLESLYFAHRAALAFAKDNFSIRDVIELRSPLTHNLFLLVRNPAVGASLIGGAFLAVLILLGVGRMRAGHFDRADQVALVAALILSPSMIALCAMEPSDCFRLFLALSSYGLLFVYNERGYSLHLFSFSILCGLMLYTGGQALYFSLALMPFVAVTALRKDVPVSTLVLVYATPLGFILASMGFLRWVFREEAVSLAVLHARFLGDLAGEAVRGSLWSSLSLAWKLLGDHLALLAPMAVSAAVSFPRWRRLRELFLFLLLWPGIELFAELASGNYRDLSVTALVIVLSSMLLLRLPPRGLPRMAARVVFLSALGLWLVQDWRVALEGPPIGANLVARTALGHTPETESGAFRSLAGRLAGEQGRILMDNGQLFPLVNFLDRPERFILPHHPGFEVAVSSPGAFARYVVVHKGNIHDQLLKKHPRAADGLLDGYVLIFRRGDILAFERI